MRYYFLPIVIGFFFSNIVTAKEITILTGSSSGTYIQIGQDIKKIAHDINVKVRPSYGSIENIYQINNSTDNIGIIQADTLPFLKKQSEHIKGYDNFLSHGSIHVLVQDNANINKLSDLLGKKVIVGSKGSYSANIAQELKIPIIHEEINERSLNKLLENKVDAIFTIGVKPIYLLEKLKLLADYRLLANKLKKLKFINIIKEDLSNLPVDKYGEQIDITISSKDYSWLSTNTGVKTVRLQPKNTNKLTPYKISENIKKLMNLYSEEIHILTNDKTINSINDLHDKKVVIGTNGSGSWVTAHNLFHIFKIQPRLDEVPITALTLEHFINKDKNIDAIFYVGGQPIPIFKKLKNIDKSKLQDLHFVPIKIEHFYNDSDIHQYKDTELTTKSYEWLEGSGNVPTISITSSLVSFSKKNPTACKIVSSIVKNINLLTNDSRNFHPKWELVKENNDNNIKELSGFIKNNCYCSIKYIQKDTKKRIKNIDKNKKCTKNVSCSTPLDVAKDRLKLSKSKALTALEAIHEAEKRLNGSAPQPQCISQ